MTDREIFDAYCDENQIPLGVRRHREAIEATSLYTGFRLRIAISELKQAIKEVMEDWKRRITR